MTYMHIKKIRVGLSCLNFSNFEISMSLKNQLGPYILQRKCNTKLHAAIISLIRSTRSTKLFTKT